MCGDVNKTGKEKIVFSLTGFKRNRHVRNRVDSLLNAKSSQLICILVTMGPKHCVMKCRVLAIHLYMLKITHHFLGSQRDSDSIIELQSYVLTVIRDANVSRNPKIQNKEQETVEQITTSTLSVIQVKNVPIQALSKSVSLSAPWLTFCWCIHTDSGTDNRLK